MTLVSTERGYVGLISKVADQDEDAARFLVRCSLFEAVSELRDLEAPFFAKAMEERTAEGRRALVRTFIERRQRGEEVDDVLKAAGYLTMINVAKAERPDDPRTKWHDARDAFGRFASAGNYSRTATAGALLQSTGDPTLSAVGTAAQAVGILGPEAEKVLGPGLQRAAYRYRGTEKRPSPTLTNGIKDYDRTVAALRKDPEAALDQVADRNNVVGQTMLHYSPKNDVGRGMSGEQRDMAIRGDIAAAYLMTQLPSARDAELSIASGRIPPSRGVIIDDEGDVVAEAVGINGDHYVPFDLKNLGRLDGGSYVRTRAAGGPTSEDLYTGLMSGARQVQVVSHSGVFTLELDPDLRGSRRYSDKARQMTSRYQEILRTLAEERVPAVDLSQQKKAELRQLALDRTDSPDKARAEYNKLVTRALQEASFNRDDDADEAKVDELLSQRATRDMSQQAVARLRLEIENELRDQGGVNPRALRLDGEGYARALDALAGEFPYFIREVRHESLREFGMARGLGGAAKLPARGPADRGYVSPGNNLAATSGKEDRARLRREADEEAAKPKATEGEKDKDGKPVAGTSGTKISAAAGLTMPTIPADRKEPAIGFDQMLEGEQGRARKQEAKAGLATMANLAGVLVGQGQVIPSEQELTSWSEEAILTEKDAHVLLWLSRKDDPIDFLATKAKPATVRKVSKALATVEEKVSRQIDKKEPDEIEELGYDFEDLAGLEKAPDALQTVLEMSAPFGDEASDEKLRRPLEAGSAPLKFGELAAMGVSIKNIDEFQRSFIANNPGSKEVFEAGKHTEALTTLAREAEALSTFVERKVRSAAIPSSMKEEDAKQRLLAINKKMAQHHVAEAVKHARHIAEMYEVSSGGKKREGEQRSTPTGPASVTFSMRDSSRDRARVRKSVTWHRAGSPVAEEFKRFLAQRSASEG